MAKKKYTFTIEVESPQLLGGFLQDIQNEIISENHQLELTRRINERTTDMHNQLLKDLVEPLNEELKSLGGKFEVRLNVDHCNGYRSSFAMFTLSSDSCYHPTITLRQYMTNRDFKDSKYSTYCGDAYEIRVGHVSASLYQKAIKLHENVLVSADRICKIEDVLEYFRITFKEILINKNKIQ